jgi:redox-sensitive bicupin YhaK (pirin superfamily)
MKLKVAERKNTFQQILSPSADDAGVWIHQDAWFHMADIDKDRSLCYSCKKKGNGIYAMVIEGAAEIAGQTLNKRDALGIWAVDQIKIKSQKSGTQILLMDVPMMLG